MVFHPKRGMPEYREDDPAHREERGGQDEARCQGATSASPSQKHGATQSREDCPFDPPRKRRVGDSVRRSLSEVDEKRHEERRRKQEGDSSDPHRPQKGFVASPERSRKPVGGQDRTGGGAQQEVTEEHAGEKTGRSGGPASPGECEAHSGEKKKEQGKCHGICCISRYEGLPERASETGTRKPEKGSADRGGKGGFGGTETEPACRGCQAGR
jgi:hypothetical protein